MPLLCAPKLRQLVGSSQVIALIICMACFFSPPYVAWGRTRFCARYKLARLHDKQHCMRRLLHYNDVGPCSENTHSIQNSMGLLMLLHRHHYTPLYTA